jgi:hypothetical protein
MRELTFGLHPMIPVVYGATLLVVWVGTRLRGALQSSTPVLRRIAAVGGAGLLAETAFFLITNFADWALQSWAFPGEPLRFPYTLSGLVTCYVVAIPFFKNALVGTALFSTALFGGYALLQKLAPAATPAPALAEAKS